MSSNFPTSLDSGITAPTTDTLGGSTPTHSQHHQNLDDRVIALETKVGIDGSAVTSTLDYILSHLSSADLSDVTAFIQTLLDDANAAAARTTLGLGTMAVETAANYLALAAGGASVENVGAIESNVNTVAATGSTETLDTSLYAVHDCTMDQNCTFTFSNPAPSGKNTTFMLILRGAFTPTFPASVDWPDGAAPTYSTPTAYIFTTVDAGTTYLGQSIGKAFA